jgi:hypothetical protein
MTTIVGAIIPVSSTAVSVATVNSGSGTKLSTVTAASMQEGQVAFVASTKAYYVLRLNAGLTVDHVNVESASGLSGAQWVRTYQRNMYWEVQTSWTVDPAGGSDDSATTSVKSLAEVARRLSYAELPASVTVTLLSDTVSTDNPVWTCRPRYGATKVTLTLTGSPTVLYTGTVTATTALGTLPSAGDDELTDSAIPVSFTASGYLGSGILYKRTNGTVRYWHPAKDLGSNTVRISRPLDGTGSFSASNLATNDTYQVLQLPKVYDQHFVVDGYPASFSSSVPNNFVVVSFLDDRSQGLVQQPVDGIQYICCTFATNKRTANSSFYNCGFYQTSTGGFQFGFGQSGEVSLTGGLMMGTGAQIYLFNFGQTSLFNSTIPTVCQGCCLQFRGPSGVSTGGWAFYDCTAPQLILLDQAGPRVYFSTISGKNNTGKLITINAAGGKAYYAVNPPVNASSPTSDASPWKIGGTSYASIPQALNAQDAGIMFQTVT